MSAALVCKMFSRNPWNFKFTKHEKTFTLWIQSNGILNSQIRNAVFSVSFSSMIIQNQIISFQKAEI